MLSGVGELGADDLLAIAPVLDAYAGTVIEATPERHVFETRPLGKLRLEAGPVELKAEVVAAPGKELMTLNRIWLRRP